MGLGSVRGIPLCIATGQAAGTAAALAAQSDATPREVNIAELQKALIEQGADLGDREPFFQDSSL
jgi:hypothetical protein